MAGVELQGVGKRFGSTAVLNGVDLRIDDGEFIVLVGPSGCGKSTLLRAVAGLEEVDAGDIRIGGRSVLGLPPAKRGIAMVFQSYALYPHMSLFENMAFGLKLAGAERGEIEAKVRGAAQLLDIEHLLDRKPKALSGGQRQRVAIGRAIVREPDVFLFDEPLSNLDAGLRVKMRYEFARLHKRLRTTTIYVTHDQVEAMTLASRIAVMNGGHVEQFGTADELYRRPASLFVAGFMGSPKMNFMEGRLEAASSGADQVRLRDGTAVAVDAGEAASRAGEPVTLGVRPEHLTPAPDGLPATVTLVEMLGNISFAYLASPASDEPLIMQLPPGARVTEGERLQLAVAPGESHLFDRRGRAWALSSPPPASIAA